MPYDKDSFLAGLAAGFASRTLIKPASSKSDAFVLTVKNEIRYYMKGDNFTIDWGDGYVETYTRNISGRRYYYPKDEERTITITGNVDSIAFEDSQYLLAVNTPFPISFANLYDCDSCFKNCTSLQKIPNNLFMNCRNVQYLRECFYNCTSLSGEAPALWKRSGVKYYSKCFYNCTKLSNYEEIPDDWK